MLLGFIPNLTTWEHIKIYRYVFSRLAMTHPINFFKYVDIHRQWKENDNRIPHHHCSNHLKSIHIMVTMISLDGMPIWNSNLFVEEYHSWIYFGGRRLGSGSILFLLQTQEN